ncbi:S8 family serine peptidase [Halovivax gelatinilyticus]|uniref:S8 family serine peptidase n=1 Tax=Halovivax gelatinilyticus TaxID=2961597 RepID=UPI0020CA43D0|nr:S8 family serine peptidase [Halovivax gelatinilyticus]
MKSAHKQLLAVTLAILMTGAVFAPIGMASGDDLTTTSVQSASGDAVTTDIDESLYDETGETELFLFLPDIAETDRQGDSDAVIDALKTQADLAQEPVISELDRYDAVDVEDTFWIRNSIHVTADLDRVSVEELAEIDGIESIEPHLTVDAPEPVDVENDVDPQQSYTYGLEQINVPEAWGDFGATGENVRVVVADTGVDADHPDIELAAEDGWSDPVGGSSTPVDNHGHGTHVSGTIAGGADSGTAIGVAPDAELANVRVCTGSGCQGAAIMESFQFAVDTDSDVINLSLGGPITGSYVDVVYNSMDAGTLVVSSIGNDGEGTSGSPGAPYDSIASGATNENLQVTSFSGGTLLQEGDFGGNWMSHWPAGSFITPDVAAPGAAVVSAQPGGGYQQMSGTSMSSPHKAGVATAILSTNDALDPWDVQDIMMDTAWKPDFWDPNSAMHYNPDTERDSRYGTGIVDLHAAVAAVGADPGIIQGTVTDDTGAAIEGATVSAGSSSDETDANGNYELSVLADTYDVTAEAFGYESDSQTVSVGEGETVTADFSLAELEEFAAVGVIGDGSYAGNVASLLDDATGEDVFVETLSSSEALDAEHDVFVVQTIDSSNVGDFVDATSGDDVGVIYLDMYEESAGDANGVTQFASVSNDVDGVDEDFSQGADGPYYSVEQSHEIVDGLGDEIPIHTDQYADHAWMTGTSFDVIAGVTVDGTSVGSGLAVDDSSATVLAASSGLSEYVSASDVTDESVAVLVNSIEYLVDGEPEPPEDGEFEVSILETNSPVTEGEDLVVDVEVEHVEEPDDPLAADVVEQTIELADFDGAVVDSEAVSLDLGDSTEISLTWNTQAGDAGSGDLTVSSEDDSDTAAVTVDAEDEPAEGFVRLGEASAAEGDVATVELDTDLANIAGYQAEIHYDADVFEFVGAEGVDLNDPVVNDDDDGVLGLAMSQASGVDAPTLAELSFEAVGEDGDSTDLFFVEENTQLNDEESVVEPAEYLAGSLQVGTDCALPGDVNGDGEVNSLDATLTQQYIAGLDPEGFVNPACGDLTGDGEITPADVTAIHQIIVGIWA